jgi:hypothetical protein
VRKLSDINTKTTEKIQKFLNTNNWIIAIGILLVFFYLSSKIGDVLDEVQKTAINVRKDIGKVIFVSSDGQIVKLKKSPVSYTDKRVARYLANTIEDSLITDLVRISEGFKKTYKNPVDLVENYKPFKEFLTYINKRWLINYANNILLLISEDNYPEYIQVYDKKINSYRVLDNNSFDIEITYYVIKRSYLKEILQPNKYVTAKDTINVKAKGFFNIVKYGSFDNPFGLKFTSIQINLLTKR